MSRTLIPTFDRGSISWIVIAALGIALLAVPIAREADAATPKCSGKKATIVGTSGSDTIRGTRRADVIVAKGGKDTIRGRGGSDIICAGRGGDKIVGGGGKDLVLGGAGNDIVKGGFGADRLRGQGANDVIQGGSGNDAINGGAGMDTCSQGGGSGTMKGCETVEEPEPPGPSADLAVSVTGRNKAPAGDVTFSVKVTNNGPDPASYTLTLVQTDQKATCVVPTWAGDHAEAELASGAVRTGDYIASCTKDHPGAKVRVRATVTSDHDPVPDNDTAIRQTKLK